MNHRQKILFNFSEEQKYLLFKSFANLLDSEFLFKEAGWGEDSDSVRLKICNEYIENEIRYLQITIKSFSPNEWNEEE